MKVHNADGKQDYIPESRNTGHPVWTGLTGIEDDYARENLEIFRVVRAEANAGEVYFAAEDGDQAHSLYDKPGGLEIREHYPIAAESFEAAKERFEWAAMQCNAVLNGLDVYEAWAEDYNTQEELVKVKGHHGVLREKGLLKELKAFTVSGFYRDDGAATIKHVRAEDALRATEKFYDKTDKGSRVVSVFAGTLEDQLEDE